MADFNENQNGVFGGIQFNKNGNEGINNDTNNNQVNGSNRDIFGNIQVNQNDQGNQDNQGNNFAGSVIENDASNFKPIEKNKAITEKGLWSRIKEFLFQEIDLYAPIKVELTPYQQKVENEINDFLHQEVTFKGIANLFKRNK